MNGIIASGGPPKVENYRQGYPRYTALLASHSAFQNLRRFTRIRMRLLLLKQDEISVLEKTLDQIDLVDPHDVFLGCHHLDRNIDRQEILQKLSTALAEYDVLIEQSQRTLSLPDADARDIDSLRNWMETNGSISRDESAYLEYMDHFNITGSVDNAIARIESNVEDCAIWLDTNVRRQPAFPSLRDPSISEDKHVFFLRPMLRTFSRILTTWIATVILLVPVIVLYNLTSSKARIVTIVFTAGGFLSIVSVFTKARTVEIVMAGASYAAVLVVFTSASNGSCSSDNYV